MKLHIYTLEDLSVFANVLSTEIKGGVILLLFGQMGVGKTALVRELELAFGAEDNVSSPTFSLINRYEWDGVHVSHLDLYRLENSREIDLLDLDRIFSSVNDGGLVIVEWSERLTEDQLPDAYISLSLTNRGEYRELELQEVGHNDLYSRLSKMLITSASGLISESNT